jgi:C4-dicarboxylate-specific signal transduction histidine kinase
MSRTSRWRLLMASVLWALLFGPAAAVSSTRNLLVLYSDKWPLSGMATIDATLDSTLDRQRAEHVQLFNEFLDLDTRRSDRYPDELVELLRHKYEGARIDVVLAVGAPALQFVHRRRAEFLPGVPVVHVAVSTHELEALALPRDIIGAPIDVQPQKTIELARRLHPAAERVVVITGGSIADRATEARLRQVLQPQGAEPPVEFWAALPINDVLSRLSRLSPRSIVYLPEMRQDGSGRRLMPQQVAANVVAASPAPVYGDSSDFAPNGTMGGYVAPLEDSARNAALLTVALLEGRPLDRLKSAPVPSAYMVNAPMLRRFDVPEASLPPGTLIRHRQPAVWEAYRWPIVAASLLLALQAALITGLLRQLRQRRRAQKELSKALDNVRLATATTGVGLWLRDLTRGETWSNAEHRATWALAEGAAPDLKSQIRLVHPDDRALVEAAVDGALAHGGDYDVQHRIHLPGGDVRWIASRGSVELDANGKPRYLRGATADVSGRVRADLDAKTLRNEVAHLSRVVTLGQLSGSIAHELNQPLTAILSNAQAALRFMNAKTVDMEALGDALRDIVADDQRAGEIIWRLRSLFQRGESKSEVLPVNTLVSDVVALVRTDLVNRNVSVSTELGANLLAIDGDRVQLQQVLFNLVFNACEAMVDVPPAARSLHIRTAQADPRTVLVSVTDAGPGVAPDQMQKIFEPFVSTKPLGIGLGLVISSSIVSAHGGRLWCTNNEHGGATFNFTLPCAPIASTGAPAPGPITTVGVKA